LDSCLFYFQKAYDLNKEVGSIASQALNLGNLADVYLELGNIKEAQKKLQEAQEINTKIQNKTNLQRNLVLLAKSYRLEKRYADAERCMKEAQTINQILKNKQQEILLFRDFAKLYQESGEYKKAIDFWEKYVNLRDSAFSKENAEQSARMQTLYETEKKEKENELLRKEQQISNAQIQRQFMVGIAILVVLLSVSILAVVLLRNNREKQRINQILTKQAQDLQQANQQITSQNEELHQQQEEIIAQRDFIEEQNKEIQYQYTQTQSSIKTALTIQEALLPFENRVGEILKDYFVLFKPRDIVSGDFYWIEKVGEETLVVAGDCTGHGVPGAFMSLIAINLLERIILQQKETSPAQILRDLHNLVRLVLKQDENDNQNGMDLAIVKLASNHQLHFAGAKRPLYYIDSTYPHEVKILAGSRKSIGGIQNETKDFKEIVLTLPPESVFYVSSDGLEDQNNPKRQRLQKEPILKILLENFEKPLIEQQINLEKLLEAHMTGTSQRDDILFLGIRV
jgi:serine phosphatase RsbU (regulator of sigma subunit)